MELTKTLPLRKQSLNEQRQALREQMKHQRKVIAHELIHATAINNNYPRSMTMRFLTQQTGIKILAELATLFIGARFLKSLANALHVAKFIKSVATKKSET